MMGYIRATFKHKISPNGFGLNVDLKLKNSGITVIFGRSGSGKTSLLRCMAGLDKAAHGLMQIGEKTWQDDGVFVPVYRRKIGYVFQEASLFSHLTARQNLAYGQKRNVTENGLQFDEIIALMGIEKQLNHFPAALSGGERQRVAIARALLSNPKLLLMDEPLASLDDARKQDILPYLERLRNEYNIPMIYVTHSMDEVARLADHLVILEAGKVIAQGSLTELLPRLDLPFHLGEDSGVVIEAKIAEHDKKWHLARAVFEGGELWIADKGEAIDQTVRLRILARDISLTKQATGETSSILNALSAVVTDMKSDDHPAMIMVQVKVGKSLFLARITAKSANQLSVKIGEKIWVNIKSVSVIR